MNAKAPPVPLQNQSSRAPVPSRSSGPADARKAGPDDVSKQGSAGKQGDAGDIRENTTHQGYQQDR